jgi:hypothetical protein
MRHLGLLFEPPSSAAGVSAASIGRNLLRLVWTQPACGTLEFVRRGASGAAAAA